MYNLQDYSCALWVQDTKNELKHTIQYIEWSEKVIKFFNNIYQLARSYVGHWNARIKLAYETMKGNAILRRISSRYKEFKHVNGEIHLPCTNDGYNVRMKGAKHRITYRS